MKILWRACALCAVVLLVPQFAAASGRTQLVASDLVRGKIAGPVAMSAFASPATASTVPRHRFEGRLALDNPTFTDGFRVIRNEPFHVPVDEIARSLPPFDFAFVQNGNALIPVRRGAIESAHREWEFVLEPGAVWDEAGDRGFTRAAFPFSLRERNANCLHNGVMSFVFRGDGTVSRVYYQISSETCAYFKFDAWGSATAHYTPGPVVDADAIKTAWRAELAARLPMRTLSDLAAAHPNLIAAKFSLGKTSDGDPPSLYGAVVDGVNYIGGCETRAGPYPYCDVLDLPSYSTAKTVFAAIGLMRLEKLWPGARNALISDYVPECATPDWSGVTFENALDMLTGVFGSPDVEADENGDEYAPFFLADTHAGKIAFACRHYHRKAQPGTSWVYHTGDTYVLGTAMQAFVRRRLGPSADLYRDVHIAQLWRKLQLSPTIDVALRTYDTVQEPYAGFGLTYHRDDIAKIASFLDMASGKLGAEPMLDEAMLASALQRDPAHRGMPAGYPHFNYIGGVWARDLSPVLGCKAEAWVPFMSGFGGISVVMLPNDTVFYYFGDSQNWDWSPAAIELAKIRPIC